MAQNSHPLSHFIFPLSGNSMYTSKMSPDDNTIPPIPDKRKSRESMDETDVIGDLVGHFGKWQFLMTMLLSLFQIPNTFHISSPVYQVSRKHFTFSDTFSSRSYERREGMDVTYISNPLRTSSVCAKQRR